ncbi:MAG: GTPase [Gammaproteobacteria bacterium]|nr:GTPase [Gammaproteobacteria bacterium]
MNSAEQRAVLNILIHAALVDGQKADAERESIREAAESLAGVGAPTAGGSAPLAGVYQDVLLRRVTLGQAVAALRELEHRQLAYELAVCVCEADGLRNPAETAFLEGLRGQLGLQGDAASSAHESQSAAIATAAASAVGGAAAYAATAVPTSAQSSAPAQVSSPASAEIDKTILNTSILNGALELLPQSWASMAIIPLQVRLVYRIGKAHGIELDQGHIKEFLATVGVGLTSQYVEQIGRKLIGGLIGKAAGKTLGGLSRAATGMAFSFASTYALGHLAKRYYAGGRVMSTALLKQTYQELLQPARQMQQEYLPAIRQRASTLNAAEVIDLVRR